MITNEQKETIKLLSENNKSIKEICVKTNLKYGVIYNFIVKNLPNSNNISKIKSTDLNGKKFGRLKVIKFLPDIRINNCLVWECKCDCGKIVNIKTHHLITNHTLSCGCLNKELSSKRCKEKFGNKNNSWKGFMEIPGSYYSCLKYGAKTRNLEFKITIQDMWNQFIKQNRKCALSGVELKFLTRLRLCDGTASLDRIDNTKGYSIDNIQWVHKDINELKSDFSEIELLKWIKLIYENKNL